jgi:DNA-binding transcriptional LysR family regulator
VGSIMAGRRQNCTISFQKRAMKIDDLLLLASLRGAASLGGSSRALGMPKATLSRRLAALEQSVGQRLFVPGARRVQLTPFGQELAERAHRHLEDIEDTREWIHSQVARPRGLLRVSVPVDFAVLLLAEPLARFAERYPEVQLDIDTSPRRVDLTREPFDLALRIGPLEDSELVARPLMQMQRGLYASPLYLATRKPPKKPADLTEHAFVSMAQTRSTPQRLLRGTRAETVAMTGRIQVNAMGLLRALALAGSGIAAFPHGMVKADVAAGALLPVLPDWQFEPLPVHLLAASRKLMAPKVRAFIDHLAETAPGWSL